ncbi:MAG: VOC family protein [Hamadaea sp.]|uniref:VOC family protein n=1 Tax=Hamadaea sp. TaxID=2024425 RepID=UPI00185C97B4|nr:VOC family protein [Hamadaea sp.]NUR72358.1 VOC family protein [Hamadaea sp.]NUT20259.1 VOC family protein [Hamadaea sp.]
MAHYSRISQIVIDAPPEIHDAEAAFWAGAIGRELPVFQRFPDFSGTKLTPDGLGLLVQRLGEGTARVHLDIHATDVEAEVTRLEALGARRVRESGPWWIMQDPAGLVFCVVPDDSLDETNARHWD